VRRVMQRTTQFCSRPVVVVVVVVVMVVVG